MANQTITEQDLHETSLSLDLSWFSILTTVPVISWQLTCVFGESQLMIILVTCGGGEQECHDQM